MPSARSRNALSGLNFLLAAVQTGFGPFVSVWLTEQGWLQTDVGFALSVGTIAGLVGQLPAGILIDATDRKRLIAGVAMAALAVSALLLAIWPVLLPVLASQVLHGFASCALVPAITALTLAMVGEDEFPVRVGINARYASLGNALAAALLGLWGTYLSQRGVLLLTAALVAPTLLMLTMIHRSDVAKPVRPNEHAARLPPNVRKQREARSWDIVREPGFLVFMACAMLFHLSNAAMLPIALNGYVANAAGMEWVISACIIVPQIVVAALSPWLGRMATVWGRRPILLFGFLALPVRGLLLAFVTHPLGLVPLGLLDGLSAAVFGVMLPLVAADVSRRIGCLNLTIGAIGLAVSIGATVSTTLAGVIADTAGLRMALLALAAAGAAAVLLVWVAMPETRPIKLKTAATPQPA
jgi:MFS family permease